MRIIIILLFCYFSTNLYSQTISTIAGNGTFGYTGDGGMAISAGIGGVGGIECDKYFNVYISSFNNTIRKISNAGIISTIAGNGIAGYSGDGGSATSAQLNSLGSWMAVDSVGNIYIADFNNHRIRKISIESGVINTVAGNGIAGFSGDGGAATSASLNSPAYMSIDRYGNLYVSDYSNYRIRKISFSGAISTVAGTGIAGYSGDGGAATSAQIFGTLGMCNDSIGNLYFSDNNRIRKIDFLTGIISTIAGTGISAYSGDGGAATTADLFAPKDVAVNNNGYLYISDRVNNRIRVVDNTGIINTIVGNGIGTYSGDGGLAVDAQIYNPQGITLDKCGNLLIVDNGNGRIRKVTMPPTLTIPTISLSVAGTAMPVGSTVTVNATVANAGSSYMIRWQNRGVEFATTTVPVVTYTKMPGVDTITARVVSTASYGCYDSTTSAPQYISDSSTGVRSVGVMGGVYVYPNPANKQVTVVAGERMRSVAISNMQGQELLRYVPDATSYTVAIDMLPQGVYMLRVDDVWVGKVVKE